MIGADFYWSFVSNKMIIGDLGPVALGTSFGWVLSGKMQGSETVSTNIIQTTVMSTAVDEGDKKLDELIKTFLKLDSIGVTNDVDNVDLIETFKENVEFDGLRHTVWLPWKQDIGILPDNFRLCKKRLTETVKK